MMEVLSNLKIEEIKTEISEIKQQAIQENKVEALTIFGSQDKPKEDACEQNGTKLLGELLGYLRTNKKMATLMVCRQISKLEMEDKCVVIYQTSEDEISNNEQVNIELKQFFEGKGLSYRVYKKNKERDPVQELNEMTNTNNFEKTFVSIVKEEY